MAKIVDNFSDLLQLAERVRLLQKELRETKYLMSKVDCVENKESGMNKTGHWETNG
ncbi:MAG: hypothetical protein K6G73_13315 [Marinilabiliaceae bacterium]|nr:hypothetical protein [Marinilabiliaceae bacterium]